MLINVCAKIDCGNRTNIYKFGKKKNGYVIKKKIIFKYFRLQFWIYDYIKFAN